ncbi:MAG: hypothetical protein A2787_10150 [Omnitrophica WOR_2 bacterium RIFCSPHIGHO2_01_FULL_48_9]|nr:MAG: hypothetical protein A3D10_04550 [Omnitrophica WOR_2 bacterium RIFCSPHIGHO2_02_FULL_48_11]OGX31484.1 MAG: hypothetical protein A2787_10150 [Omnitrophica WOR_2 bacterium RIFCSPHIGHO2_01_FULL_48_9]
MAQKGKKIAWHKKSSKLVSSKFLKARGKKMAPDQSADGPAAAGNKMATFVWKLKMEIHKAVHPPTPTSRKAGERS